jgi:UDP-N-acetylmuramoylalanine-D-glutamate ligase
LTIVSKIDKDYNKEKVLVVLKRFSTLPHRQEDIGTYKNITFIDDSIAVTQESTIAAIETFGKNIGTIFL